MSDTKFILRNMDMLNVLNVHWTVVLLYTMHMSYRSVGVMATARYDKKLVLSNQLFFYFRNTLNSSFCLGLCHAARRICM